MDKLTEYAVEHRTTTAQPVSVPTYACPANVLKSTCQHCGHLVMTILAEDGRILPWWHRVTGLERCEGWSSR